MSLVGLQNVMIKYRFIKYDLKYDNIISEIFMCSYSFKAIVDTIHEFLIDIFKTFGKTYYGLTSELGYFERTLIVLFLYVTPWIWIYLDIGRIGYFTSYIKHLFSNFF